MLLLTFQAAVTEGFNDKKVLYIAPKKFNRLPPTVHAMPKPSASAMNNIKFS